MYNVNQHNDEMTSLKEELKKLRVELSTYKKRDKVSRHYEQSFYKMSDAAYYFKLYENKTSSHFIEVNEVAFTRLGYTREEMLKMSPKHIDRTRGDQLQEIYKKVYMNETYTFETTHVCKDGTFLPVEIKTHILEVEDNGDKLIFSICRDLTNSKKTEEELYILESFYNHSNEGIAIFDLEGKIIQANKAFESIFGYKEEEVKCRRLPVTPAVSKKEAEYLLAETLKGNHIKNFATIKQRKDGRYITVSITMSPLRNKYTGAIYALSGIVRDVTEQLAIMNQLESFIDYNLDPILIFDEHDQLIRLNYAFEETFGWTAKELTGVKIMDMPIIPEHKQQEVENFSETVRLHKGIQGYETIRKTRDGTMLDVLLTTFAINQNNNHMMVVTLKDISHKKEAERVLINSEKISIVGQLSASIAHEIRNPLTAIKGFMKLAKEGSVQLDIYSIIDSEIDRIETISSELLVLGKPQSKELKHSDVGKLLKDVCVLMQSQANFESVFIHYEEVEFDLYCECNEQQVKQVFMNIIKNAI
ncbi:PAS domain-containing sensor histidine kinase [Metabacillus endolithicus]|uniref:histidine kinase n=1 Tax=Metabacillus endolithicus TaxID=1535204 RepID=A0ABW5C152_9BACI|nr:PAS domain-containing sensor histidine kinase [Metabacillus endolithicus]UPG63939.1 PAS domain S-box protein [Metabacillus endolithicus]